jgi:hypothetical protein
MLFNWIIIFVLVMIGIYLLKINHFKHRFWIFFLVFIAIFLFVSISVVQSKYHLSFATFDDLSKSVKIYLGWLSNGFGNMKVLTGNAIKMDWTSSSDNSVIDKVNLSLKGKPVK